MNKIVEEAIRKIKELEKNTPCGKHIITGDVRKLSSKLFSQIEDKSIENVFILCEELLNEHSWALGVIAFDFAYRMKNHYNESTYDIFYRWLKDYVRGWGDCDDFWIRRASAVILIPSIMKNDYEGIEPFTISDRLMSDSHNLVLKGYGWMLKALSQINPSCVKEYLIKNVKKMPRVAYRYALEKFDKETRNKLMQM